ncbi:DUF2201 family putative metallopeptidase [Fervidobacterium thailandense]|uniref:VWA-like domain-containing protein n=1 Tax=Fervidobacterium thailandense TaxID=1008305 RepID=A0A1E3G4I6_9BACT|nr:VWA-like domain-containing protein [Fervidobacterium thailandense]ODN31167.1 hypothetical protein A4H02_02605 [Fervidobacterium thailandense]
MNSQEKLRYVVNSLIRKNPFYGYLLLGTSYREAQVRNVTLTLSKSGDFVLLYNPVAVAAKSEELLEALVLHELMHYINRHYLIKPKDERDKKIWDLAKDAAINQFIPLLDAYSIPLNVLIAEGHGTDNEIIFVGPPVDMLNRTAEEYHDYIISELRRNDSFDLEVVAESLPNEHSETFDLPLDVVLELLDERIGKAFNLFGHELPSGLMELIGKSVGSARIDWRTALQRFFGVSQRSDKYQTPLRPNRRYEDQPGWRYTYEPRITVIIDTSGSIIEEEMNEFLTEVESIARVVGGFKLIQVDKSVRFVTEYRLGKWKDLEIYGGGETDLQPAVDMAEHDFRSEGIVIFTDGYVDLPKVTRRVLFVLSRQHNVDFYLDAKRIYGSVYVLGG